jgi:hypothetical protein
MYFILHKYKYLKIWNGKNLTTSLVCDYMADHYKHQILYMGYSQGDIEIVCIYIGLLYCLQKKHIYVNKFISHFHHCERKKCHLF